MDELRPEGAPHKKQIQLVKDRPGHDRRYVINAMKSRQQLGYNPHESFETGIRKTLQWYLDYCGWWQALDSGTRWFADINVARSGSIRN